MGIDSKMRIRGALALVAIATIVGILGWWTGGFDKVIAANSTGRAKAEALIAAYAKHAGAHDSTHQTLDTNDDRSFGDFGFHYYPEKDMLRARVYMFRSHIKDRPDRAVYEQKSNEALNNPKIGGMYDRGGGYFWLDAEQQIMFLVKDYPLQSTNTEQFIKDVDNLRGLAGPWLMWWGPHVADQAFGHEPPPTHFVDREHNPYSNH